VSQELRRLSRTSRDRHTIGCRMFREDMCRCKIARMSEYKSAKHQPSQCLETLTYLEEKVPRRGPQELGLAKVSQELRRLPRTSRDRHTISCRIFREDIHLSQQKGCIGSSGTLLVSLALRKDLLSHRPSCIRYNCYV